MRSNRNIAGSALLFSHLLLLVASVLMAFSALIYLILNVFFGQGSSQTLYWLAFSPNADHLMINLSCGGLFIVGVALACLVILSNRFRTAKPYSRLRVYVLFATVLAAVFMMGAEFTRSLSLGWPAYWETVDSATLDTHRYHLLLYSSDWATSWGKYYSLYECDSLDWFCREVTFIPKRSAGDSPDVQTIRLVTDVTSNVIIVEVNGANAFTHYSK